MKHISKVLAAFAVLLLSTTALRADADKGIFTPIDAVYMVRDPSATSGYKEKVRWKITSENDWSRFYDSLPRLPKDPSKTVDPIKTQAPDIVMLTENDPNGLTGRDVYVSSLGVMLVERGSRNAWFPDNNKLRAFLEDEQKQRGSFDSFTKGPADPGSKGIVVTYNINASMPNPSWVITSQDDIRLYDSFFKAIIPLTDKEAAKITAEEKNPGDFGNFILVLNYPEAPARVATVSKQLIRLSNSSVRTEYYQDTQGYYKFFRDQAREIENYDAKYKDAQDKVVKKTQF